MAKAPKGIAAAPSGRSGALPRETRQLSALPFRNCAGVGHEAIKSVFGELVRAASTSSTVLGCSEESIESSTEDSLGNHNCISTGPNCRRKTVGQIQAPCSSPNATPTWHGELAGPICRFCTWFGRRGAGKVHEIVVDHRKSASTRGLQHERSNKAQYASDVSIARACVHCSMASRQRGSQL